jgi:hypothetical protein
MAEQKRDLKNPFFGKRLWGITQGCQMVCLETKNLILGKFLRAFECKMFI